MNVPLKIGVSLQMFGHDPRGETPRSPAGGGRPPYETGSRLSGGGYRSLSAITAQMRPALADRAQRTMRVNEPAS